MKMSSGPGWHQSLFCRNIRLFWCNTGEFCVMLCFLEQQLVQIFPQDPQLLTEPTRFIVLIRIDFIIDVRFNSTVSSRTIWTARPNPLTGNSCRCDETERICSGSQTHHHLWNTVRWRQCFVWAGFTERHWWCRTRWLLRSLQNHFGC